VVHLVVLDCVLRATTKKRSSNFWRKKCTSQRNILANGVDPGSAYRSLIIQAVRCR